MLIFVISAEKVPGFDFVPLTVHRRRVFFGLMNLDTFIEGASAWDRPQVPGSSDPARGGRGRGLSGSSSHWTLNRIRWPAHPASLLSE